MMSPFDAISKTSLGPDGQLLVNRFGIGFGQRGYAGSKSFPTLEAAQAEFEARLADLRNVYGTPAKNWTGKFIEDETVVTNSNGQSPNLVRSVRFVPLKKNGKPGVTIHTVTLYRINVSDKEVAEIAASLRQDVA